MDMSTIAKLPLADGSWLSSPGSYQRLISQLVSSDPRLRQRDPKTVRQGSSWPNKHAKLIMLKLQSDGSFDAPAEFTPQSLQQHFRTAGVSGASNYSRVYILEGLHPDFVSVLGEHFGMHPSFFVDHERVVVNADVAAKEADTLVLPSLLKSRQHCTMKYFQLFVLPHNVRGCFKMCCQMTGRHIGITRVKGTFSSVGILRRKCSFWTRQAQPGQSWECLIITDPPLQVVRLAPDEKTNTVVPIALTHFQGGYLDFMPHEMQMRTQSGPPRTSMLDDICFYIRTYANLINTGTPEGILLFAKKIVASHYLQHAQFMRSIISTTQFHMSRKAAIRLEQFSGEFVEAQWSDGQALERRMCEYCEDLEGIML